MKIALGVALVVWVATAHAQFETDIDLHDTNPGTFDVVNSGPTYATYGENAANYVTIPFDAILRPASFVGWRVLFDFGDPTTTAGLQLYDFTNNEQIAEELCGVGNCAFSATPAFCQDLSCDGTQPHCSQGPRGQVCVLGQPGNCGGTNSCQQIGLWNAGVVITSAWNAMVAAGGSRLIGLRTKNFNPSNPNTGLYGSRLEVTWTTPVAGDTNRVFENIDFLGPQPSVRALLGSAATSFSESGNAPEATRLGPYRFSLGLAASPRAIWRVVWNPNTAAAGSGVALYNADTNTPIAEIICSGTCDAGVACVIDAACAGTVRDVRVDVTSAWNALRAGAVDRSLSLRTKGAGGVAPTVYHANLMPVEDLG